MYGLFHFNFSQHAIFYWHNLWQFIIGAVEKIYVFLHWIKTQRDRRNKVKLKFEGLWQTLKENCYYIRYITIFLFVKWRDYLSSWQKAHGTPETYTNVLSGHDLDLAVCSYYQGREKLMRWDENNLLVIRNFPIFTHYEI